MGVAHGDLGREAALDADNPCLALIMQDEAAITEMPEQLQQDPLRHPVDECALFACPRQGGAGSQIVGVGVETAHVASLR